MSDSEIWCLEDEIAALRAENERLIFRLTACGVAALSNTSESAAQQRDIAEEYKSASWDEVCRAVDREMALRTRIAELEASNAALSARVGDLGKDATRYRWLRERVTFHDIDPDWPVEAPNVPTLAQVSDRLWYHATDDIDSSTIDQLIDTALTANPKPQGSGE